MARPVVSIVKCKDYQTGSVYAAVKKSSDLAGGISSFVSSGSKVLIKPCVLKANEPQEGVNTHPEVVRAVIRLVKEAGGLPVVGDSPIGVQDIDEAYQVSGIKKVCLEEQTELVKFKQAEIIDGIPIAKPAREADVIISVPKFKTHGLTILTAAVKSIFGVVPGLFKVKCHEMFPEIEDFSRNLVRIFSYVKPQFTVVDAIVCMEGNGPVAGGLRNTGVILASKDSVAADAVLARMMGIEPLSVFTTRYAYEMSLGIGKTEDIDIVGEALTGVTPDDFKLPTTVPFFNISVVKLKMLGTKTIDLNKPAVKEKLCTFCKKCIEICPAKAIYKQNGRIRFDYNKCKLCLCCSEACPENAIYINKGIFNTLEKLKTAVKKIKKRIKKQ